MSGISLMDQFRATAAKNRVRIYVKIRLRHKALGGHQANADQTRAWLAAKSVDPAHIEKQLARIQKPESIEEAEAQITTVFFRNAKGPYIGAYQFKRAIHEMLSTTGITVAKKGSKQTAQHLADVHPATPDGRPVLRDGEVNEEAENLYFYDANGGIITETTFEQMAGTTNGPTGPRSFVKRAEAVDRAYMHFIIALPAGLEESRRTAVITPDDIVRILAHAQDNAIGSSRTQGFGAFDVLDCRIIEEDAANVLVKGKKVEPKAEEPKVEADAEEGDGDSGEADAEPEPTKRRGRPPGSKSKPKT